MGKPIVATILLLLPACGIETGKKTELRTRSEDPAATVDPGKILEQQNADAAVWPPESADASAVPYFTTHIRPILDAHCTACHASKETGAASIGLVYANPEQPDAALWDQVVESVSETRMPPPAMKQVPPGTAELLQAWQNAGYPYAPPPGTVVTGPALPLDETEKDNLETKRPDGPVNFNDHIKSIVDAKCVACHNKASSAAGLRFDLWESQNLQVDTATKWLRATNAVLDQTMPPSSFATLSDSEITLWREWFQNGMPQTAARSPDSGDNLSCTSGGDLPMSRIIRLSDTQLKSTLIGYFGYDGFYKSMPSIFSFVFDLLPKDFTLSKGLGNSYQQVSDAHVEAQLILAKFFAAKMVGITDRWSRIYPGCLTSGKNPDDACLRTFISSWGFRMYKRPLSSAELTRYETLFRSKSSPSEGLTAVWTAFALSPYFLYVIDDQGQPDPSDPTVYERTPFEIAALMAYSLTGAGPDKVLLAKASDGSLTNSETMDAEYNRLMALSGDNWRLFSEQWLGLYDVPGIDGVSSHYMSRTGVRYFDNHGTPAGEDAFALKAFSNAIISAEDGRFQDFFSFPLNYKNAVNWSSLGNLSAVYYGYPRVNVGSDLPERRGLLTHLAFINQNQNYTDAIRRGIKLRERLLCQDVGEFPAEQDIGGITALPERGEDNKDKTMRHIIENVTENAACQSCHKYWNFAFAMDDYGAVGELRTKEHVVGLSGGELKYLGALDLNTAVAPHIDGPGEAPVSGTMDLQARLAGSRSAQMCFVSKLALNHMLSRAPTSSDKCMSEDLHQQMTKSGGSIRGMMRYLMGSKYLRYKKVSK